MSCIREHETTFEEKYKQALEYKRWVENELSNARGYWYKLKMKKELKSTKEWIEQLFETEKL